MWLPTTTSLCQIDFSTVISSPETPFLVNQSKLGLFASESGVLLFIGKSAMPSITMKTTFLCRLETERGLGFFLGIKIELCFLEDKIENFIYCFKLISKRSFGSNCFSFKTALTSLA